MASPPPWRLNTWNHGVGSAGHHFLVVFPHLRCGLNTSIRLYLGWILRLRKHLRVGRCGVFMTNVWPHCLPGGLLDGSPPPSSFSMALVILNFCQRGLCSGIIFIFVRCCCIFSIWNILFLWCSFVSFCNKLFFLVLEHLWNSTYFIHIKNSNVTCQLPDWMCFFDFLCFFFFFCGMLPYLFLVYFLYFGFSFL